MLSSFFKVKLETSFQVTASSDQTITRDIETCAVAVTQAVTDPNALGDYPEVCHILLTTTYNYLQLFTTTNNNSIGSARLAFRSVGEPQD